MLARGKGAIVNVSSLASIRYGYPYISYQASKAGLNQLTQGVALQYARQGIRANAILPGMIDTPLIHQQIVGQYASAEAMRRRAQRQDADGPPGHGLGHRQRRAVPGQRRRRLHHRRVPAGRRWAGLRDDLMDAHMNLQHLLSLYRTMARIRAFEEAAEIASSGGVQVFGAAAERRRQGARAAAPVDRAGGRAVRRLRAPATRRLA
jgi:NAD(P)-dependent dehydrogenase (short-subunit alcohol dehydrogenase family)